MRASILVPLFLGLIGCSEPFWLFPGGALGGIEAPYTGDIPKETITMQLETQPTEPYSVNVGFVVINGQLYIDPTEERAWYSNMLVDSHVRIRFEGSNRVHPMTAIKVTDPAITGRFEEDRRVLRLEPR